MSLYRIGEQTYSVVDDRRWVEVHGGALVLDHLDPGATLQSLVIEPLSATRDDLVVGGCTRDLVEQPAPPAPRPRRPQHPPVLIDIYAPDEPADAGDEADDGDDGDDAGAVPAGAPRVVGTSVRCTVTATPGKHLVRVLYISTTLAYSAQHEIEMTSPSSAMLVTRYSIPTPAWGGSASVTLYDGMPGHEQAPIVLAQGSILLDGSTAFLSPPSRDVAGRLRRVYTGEMVTGSDDPDAVLDASGNVWVWLELELERLASGPIHAHVRLLDETEQEVTVPVAMRDQRPRMLRIPLWIDPAISGSRTRRRVGGEGRELAEWHSFAITNRGSEPRTVWIEQRLEEARRRAVSYGQPAKPTLGTQRARLELVVPARSTARAAFTIVYSF